MKDKKAKELLFSFKDMLKEAYMQAQRPSVEVETQFLVQLHLTKKQEALWSQVMALKK